MPPSEKLAIAARLHVLLRRKTGRVTDVEWMAAHPDYAEAMIVFSRQKAQELGDVELAEWAGKFEQLMPRAPQEQRAPKRGLFDRLKGHADDGEDHQYVGGLR